MIGKILGWLGLAILVIPAGYFIGRFITKVGLNLIYLLQMSSAFAG